MHKLDFINGTYMLDTCGGGKTVFLKKRFLETRTDCLKGTKN